MEAAHRGDSLTRTAATLTLSALRSLLEAGSCTCAALDKRCDVEFFLHALCSIEEGYVGLYFDVVADEDFFLEWVASSASFTTGSSSAGESTK